MERRGANIDLCLLANSPYNPPLLISTTCLLGSGPLSCSSCFHTVRTLYPPGAPGGSSFISSSPLTTQNLLFTFFAPAAADADEAAVRDRGERTRAIDGEDEGGEVDEIGGDPTGDVTGDVTGDTNGDTTGDVTGGEIAKDDEEDEEDLAGREEDLGEVSDATDNAPDEANDSLAPSSSLSTPLSSSCAPVSPLGLKAEEDDEEVLSLSAVWLSPWV